MKPLANLGPASVRMLNGVGIQSEQDLRALGAVAAYVAVKASGANASLNLLWALEGALTGRHWRVVAREDRMSLLMQLDDFERSRRQGGTALGGRSAEPSTRVQGLQGHAAPSKSASSRGTKP